MKIALSPANVTPVTATFEGSEFTFNIKHFTFDDQDNFEAIVDSSIKSKSPIKEFYQERWNYAISDCTLEEPFEKLPVEDIKNILKLVNDINYGVDEKKS